MSTGLLALSTFEAAAYLFLFRNCIGQRRRYVRMQQAGLEINSHLKSLVQTLQQHRGLCAVYLSGRTDNADQISVRAQTIEERIEHLDHLMASLDRPQLLARWQAIATQWKALHHKVRGMEPGASFRTHTGLIQHNLELLREVGEETRLHSDLGQDHQAMAEILVHHLPSLTELLGQLRALGAGAASRGRLSTVTAMRLRFLKERAQSAITAIDDGMETSGICPPAARAQHMAASAAAGGFLSTVDQLLALQETPNSLSPEDYFARGTRAIDGYFALADELSPVLATGYSTRLGRLRRYGLRVTTLVGAALAGTAGYALYTALAG